jgi:hypothetical protein
MNIINKEYFWDIKNNFIYIYKYKKNKNLKIIFINKDENEEDNDIEKEDIDIDDEEDIDIDDEEDEEYEEDIDEEDIDEEDEEYEEDNIEDEDIVININEIYEEDNIDYLNAKNLLNSIILPRTFSYKHLIVPIQFYKNNNKIIVLGSYAITNLELLKTLYEFYNVKVLSTDELEEINNDDYWNYVDNAKELKNPHYLNTLGLLTNFKYIDRIENDIFRFELN